MSVASNVDIRRGIAQGNIILRPMIDDNIRGSSIDLTLGEWYYRCGSNTGSTFYNPFDPESVDRFFGEPKQAKWELDEHGDPFPGIPEEHPVILLQPGERILAHTHEFAGVIGNQTSEIRARSSWGRNGITVCMCAGWGDPGYFDRWTLEIQNHNRLAVPLPAGERVAQLIVHQTGQVQGQYGESGKYQASTDPDIVIAEWRPQDMLPRSYRDQRKLPLPVTEVTP